MGATCDGLFDIYAIPRVASIALLLGGSLACAGERFGRAAAGAGGVGPRAGGDEDGDSDAAIVAGEGELADRRLARALRGRLRGPRRGWGDGRAPTRILP